MSKTNFSLVIAAFAVAAWSMDFNEQLPTLVPILLQRYWYPDDRNA